MELSRDKIKEIINDDWLLMDDCEGNKNCDVVKELARISLASLELERGMIRRFDLDMSNCDSCGQDCGADMVEDLDGEYVLWDDVLPHLYRYDEYTATPSTVSVPLAIHDEDFEKALSVLNDTLDDCGDSELGLLLALDKAGIEVRSDACRAAMIQGANPVQGWIPCSDRMPEFYFPVLVTDEHEDMAIALPVYLDAGGRCAFQLSNGDIFIATHWMPLPAAPQQEADNG
ncbi:DUF551 domain-containing protein [Escherichia fergusonii]|uniref:DUF551 domain-containing protein n=1 Tax=Escherichia fergusonii TaxID=564 RepID=UPI001CBEB5C3|nr:DUF551 domain-containing protein [Escherichia fergusonii]UAT38387.1 DUF551 domain-containing protein [Escherichia fergusonii]HDS0610364.1 DUF551 domain-containing protein [Escherichia coli]